MARPRFCEPENRTKFDLAMTKETKAAIAREAARRGVTPSKLVRQWIDEKLGNLAQ